ncbi:MAG: hypothetical protein EP326_11805 [Deltaproteobacteria bacterium]|nr:MAG: hypothetical protein EP326_11805 [Deltaproteobacteria bacterium]TNF29007.1 MAG: hypothetical protein EP319_07870 [Deltaproteobacteria bacterium]
MKLRKFIAASFLLSSSLFAQDSHPGRVIVDTGDLRIDRRDIRINPVAFKKGYSFHYIADLPSGAQPRSATELMQAEFGNQVIVTKHNGNQTSLYQVTNQESVPELMESLRFPNFKKCAVTPDPTTSVFDTPNYTSAGRNAFPAGVDGSWNGSSGGGCGTWATMMCNRILGKTNSGTAPSRNEWNDVAGGIGQNTSGGSTISGRAKYYEGAGYCSSFEIFEGTTASYKKMAKHIKDGCDLKLSFWKKNPNGTLTNGHVEVVTGVNFTRRGVGSATTNSWGKPATVSGGNNGGFSHSEDRVGGNFNPGGNWPANSTVVAMEYVCKCSTLQSLAKLLGLR